MSRQGQNGHTQGTETYTCNNSGKCFGLAYQSGHNELKKDDHPGIQYRNVFHIESPLRGRRGEEDGGQAGPG